MNMLNVSFTFILMALMKGKNSSKIDHVCSDILLTGYIRESGLYFITTKNGKHLQNKEDLDLPRQTPGTAAYDDLAGHYLYHKKKTGWVIVQKELELQEEFRVIASSNVMDLNVVKGGVWKNGIKISCLDNNKCSALQDLKRDSKGRIVKNMFPFNGRDRPKDGILCAKVENRGLTFAYINATDRDGFPIYSSGSQYLARSDSGDRSLLGSYRIFSLDQELDRSINGFMKGFYQKWKNFAFNAKKAVCKSVVFDAIPASSTHAHWELPENSLQNATSWELGMTVKILASTIDTFFVAVRWAPGGYSGFQDLADNRDAPSFEDALVSMWNYKQDMVETTYINSKAGVKEKSFAKEGNGRKAWIDYPWVKGKPTSIKIKGKLVNPNSNKWQVDGYVQDLKDPLKWVHMVSFTRASPLIPGHHAANILRTPLATWGFSAFIEDYHRPECSHGYMYKRSAEFLSPYAKVNGAQVKLASPVFATTPTGSDAYARHLVSQKKIGPEGSGNVFLSTGGSPKYT